MSNKNLDSDGYKLHYEGGRVDGLIVFPKVSATFCVKTCKNQISNAHVVYIPDGIE